MNKPPDMRLRMRMVEASADCGAGPRAASFPACTRADRARTCVERILESSTPDRQRSAPCGSRRWLSSAAA
eukprot:4336458-Prymnesium_polylepis.1